MLIFLDSVYLEDSFWSSFQWIFKGFARKLCLLQISWSWNAGEGKKKTNKQKKQHHLWVLSLKKKQIKQLGDSDFAQ